MKSANSFGQHMTDRQPSYRAKAHRKKSGLVLGKQRTIRRDMRKGRKPRFL